jgi:peroxiredoxin
MTNRIWLAAAAAGLFMAQPATAHAQATAQAETKTTGKVGEKMPAFTAKVVRGDKTVDFDSAKNAKTTVYFTVGVTCPATGPYKERYAALEAAYMPKGVDFVYLYVNSRDEPPELKQKFHKQCKFQGVFLNDEGSAIAKKLAAVMTGEALIVDKDGKVVYRGGIDDNRNDAAMVKSKHVAKALDEILAGKPVSTPSNKDVFG